MQNSGKRETKVFWLRNVVQDGNVADRVKTACLPRVRTEGWNLRTHIIARQERNPSTQEAEIADPRANWFTKLSSLGALGSTESPWLNKLSGKVKID